MDARADPSAVAARPARRWAAALGLAFALAATAAVYRPILAVGFHFDDWLHLYDIANDGAGLFILKNYFGHLQLTRNAVFVLLAQLFGVQPRPFMWAMLLSHLAAVALLYAVALHLTRRVAPSAAVAALWGTAPVHAGVLGWYSVHGQVLATLGVLWVVLQLVRLAGDDRRRVAPRWTWVLALLAASTSFGAGLALTLALPAVAWLLLPTGAARRRVVGTLVGVAVGCAVLYLLMDALNARLFAVPSATLMRPGDGGEWARFAEFVARLSATGLASLVAGPLLTPTVTMERPQAIALVAGLALLAVAVPWLTGRERRWLAALLLLSLAPYAVVGLGRAALAGNVGLAVGVGGRYHYAASLGLALAVALALAALGRAPRPLRGACAALAVAWLGVLAATHVRAPVAVPTFADQTRDADDILARIGAAIAAAPPGAPVFIDNGPFLFSTLPELRIGRADMPLRFPGWAALFVIHYPDNVVDGRRVYFVVNDADRLARWRHGRRAPALLVYTGGQSPAR